MRSGRGVVPDMHLNGTMNTRVPLQGKKFDVVVIGGGVNGVAIARECVRSGRSTLLVEQHDFAAGTTSRSTRIIHGGLRYLEHGDIEQVRESLKERQRLLRDYPNLVHPLQFVLALNGDSLRTTMTIRAGLWLYRRFGGTKALANSKGQQSRFEKLLDSGRRFSLFSYEDAQCEFPERMVAEWLLEAIHAGCIARNYCKVIGLTKRDGRVTSAVVRDEFTRGEEQVEADWILNATGPWVDHVCQAGEVTTANPMIGGVRGSHIVLPKFEGAPEAGLYGEAVDGRPMFILPWNGQILVGTTEVADSGDPERVRPSDEEIRYLLESFGKLFQGIAVSASDIQYSFAGVRPLPYSPDSSPAATTRRHSFHDHTPEGAAGLISVIGGKLTTAAKLARECVEKIGGATAPRHVTEVGQDVEIDRSTEIAIEQVAELGSLSSESARGLVEWYGPRSFEIARGARTDEKLRRRLCPHTNHIVAEGVDALQNQCAVTLGDVLLRRAPVALGACWSKECTRTAAWGIREALRMDEAEMARQIEDFECERDAFLRRPSVGIRKTS